jgi:hypothetical protein
VFIDEILPEIGDQKAFRVDELKLIEGGLSGQVYIKSKKADVQFKLGQISLEYDYNEIEIQLALVKVEVLNGGLALKLLEALIKGPKFLINFILKLNKKMNNSKISARMKGNILHISIKNAIKDMVEIKKNENSILNMLSFEDVSRGELSKIDGDTVTVKLF